MTHNVEKNVYCEWILTITKDSKELLRLAEHKNVRYLFGVKRILGSSIRYYSYLIKQVSIRKVHAASMAVNADACPDVQSCFNENYPFFGNYNDKQLWKTIREAVF